MPKEDTQFKPGQSGNPGGRPVGARNRLSKAFIEALADSFEDNGRETLERLRKEQPAQYAATISKLMPKLMELSGPDGAEIPMSATVRFLASPESD